MGIEINVELGGDVTLGQPFKWKNKGSNKVKASGLSTVCPNDSYDVPGAANGKDGEKDASVLPTATVGTHEYTIGPGQTNPSLKVNSSSK